LVATGDDITGPINLGNPHEIPVKELADRVLRLTGSSSRIVYRSLPADDPVQRCPNIELARGTLDWEPHVPLDDGLARTVAYFSQMLAQRAEK
jgi:UDP-glucuronate decarboxylase